MEQSIKKVLKVEDEFFNLDDENKIAYLKLKFDTPKDIFSNNFITKMPVLNEDFAAWVKDAFELTPKKYKIDLVVTFDDMEGYNNEELTDIFNKNMLLEFKKNERKENSKKVLAFILTLFGILLFIGMLFMKHLWTSEGVAKDICIYIADIATTVTFWEAMTIFVVQSIERKNYMRNLISRFKTIEFKEESH